MGQLVSACLRDKAQKYALSDNSKNTAVASTAAAQTVAPSWANRKKIDPRDFMFSKLTSGVHIKPPGSIQGAAEFNMEDCSDCELMVLDHVVQSTIDDCKRCLIILGISESRNCVDCTVIVGCRQFRARDCHRCRIILFAATQPIIETSSELEIGCFSLNYLGLDKQFQAAHVSRWNNLWFNIYDFNAAEQQHYKLLHKDACEIKMSEESRLKLKEFNVALDSGYVPFTAGTAISKSNCSVVVMVIGLEETVDGVVFGHVSQLDQTVILRQSHSIAIDDANAYLPHEKSMDFRRQLKSHSATCVCIALDVSLPSLEALSSLTASMRKNTTIVVRADPKTYAQDLAACFIRPE